MWIAEEGKGKRYGKWVGGDNDDEKGNEKMVV